MTFQLAVTDLSVYWVNFHILVTTAAIFCCRYLVSVLVNDNLFFSYFNIIFLV